MARLAITFAVLFFLFTFSGAHLQVFPTENDLSSQEDDSSKSVLPAADADNSNPTLLLPSDKPDVSDSAAADESASSAEVETVDVNDLVHVTLPEPAAFVSFHPINRRFRTNRQFPPRYTRRRPCRHFVRPMNHRSSDQISYGTDMILSNNDMKLSNNEKKGLDPELLFRDQVIPSMALRFQRENHHHHHHHHDHHHGRHHHNEFMSKYVFAREKLKRPFRREQEEERETEGRENGGLVKRFRKFLNHF